jgi:hypothetical protein
MHRGHAGILAPADEGDDFKRVAFGQALLGVTGAGDDGGIELDRDRAGELEMRDEILHRGRGGELNFFAVDVNNHGACIIGFTDMLSSAGNILRATGLATVAALAGCGAPEYDLSTPDAAIDSLHEMIVGDHAEAMTQLIHIPAREDIVFDDGVTEASAIEEVRLKAGEMLGQLFRVARKLRERFPDEVADEATTAADVEQSPGVGPWVARFLTNPFGLLEEQRQRLTAEDLGDGTAAMLVDGEPMSGIPLRLVDVDGAWRIELPIELLDDYRPNTRHEWSVVASMLLSIENTLDQFEDELDAGGFRSLTAAGERAGRMIGESIVAQGLIYRMMKRHADAESAPP